MKSNSNLKTVIQWTIYIAILIVSLFTLISLLIVVIAPTFLPSVNISGFKNYISTFGLLLSFLSVGLGTYSIYQAFASGKQATEMIQSLQTLKEQQELVLVSLKSIKDLKIVSSQKTTGQWTPDDIVS